MSQQINLFNPLFMRKEKYFSARTMLQSLVLIALGMVAPALLERGLVGEAERREGFLRQVRLDQLPALGGRHRLRGLGARLCRRHGSIKAGA